MGRAFSFCVFLRPSSGQGTIVRKDYSTPIVHPMRWTAGSGRLFPGGPRPSWNSHPLSNRRKEMLDYLRIMINARLAKMDERGASAVEYGLLVAGIAAVVVGIVFLLGGTLSGVFQSTNDSIAPAAS